MNSHNETVIPETLTVEQACSRLGCSRAHLFNLIEQGALATFKVGRWRMVRAESLAALIDAATTVRGRHVAA